ncbi:MAG: tetratricopeptide repeat protein, partial [Candidatus Omnitrophota bacterium]
MSKIKYCWAILICLIASLCFINDSFAIDKKASLSLSHYIMAIIYDDLGDVRSAIQEYKSALRTDKKNIVIHLNLALAYIKNNDIEKAVEELNTCVKIDTQAVESHAILAFLYSLQNKTEEANVEYETALKNAAKRNPENISIYKDLGFLYLQQKKLDAAEKMYRLVIDASDKDADAHYYLACIYDEKGDKKELEKELKKVLEINPDYHEALNYLGYFYVEQGKNLDEAEKLIKKALKLQPDNGAYVDSLGWLYFKKGDINLAIKTLTQAIGLLKDPVIYEHLGDA